MATKVITVWERHTRQKDGSWKWEFNHISNNFDKKLYMPKAVSTVQEKAWSNAKWRSSKAYLIGCKVVEGRREYG
ncbi:MAG: hypothetical protein PVG39_07855, partial [Desulfobacteraceae bacterium]